MSIALKSGSQALVGTPSAPLAAGCTRLYWSLPAGALTSPIEHHVEACSRFFGLASQHQWPPFIPIDIAKLSSVGPLIDEFYLEGATTEGLDGVSYAQSSSALEVRWRAHVGSCAGTPQRIELTLFKNGSPALAVTPDSGRLGVADQHDTLFMLRVRAYLRENLCGTAEQTIELRRVPSLLLATPGGQVTLGSDALLVLTTSCPRPGPVAVTVQAQGPGTIGDLVLPPGGTPVAALISTDGWNYVGDVHVSASAVGYETARSLVHILSGSYAGSSPTLPAVVAHVTTQLDVPLNRPGGPIPVDSIMFPQAWIVSAGQGTGGAVLEPLYSAQTGGGVTTFSYVLPPLEPGRYLLSISQRGDPPDVNRLELDVI